MTVEAKVNPTYLAKWAIMAALLLAFAGWCIYDAKVGYPAHNRKVAAFYHYQDEKPREYYTPAGEPRGWTPYTDDPDYAAHEDYADFAEAQGWSTDKPGVPKTDFDIQTQWFMLYLAGGLAAASIVWAGLHLGRKLRADDGAFIAANGRRIPYEAITDIDKERWDSKGIAIVHYEMDGKKGKAKIDDWVFRDADRVLEQVERGAGLTSVVPG